MGGLHEMKATLVRSQGLTSNRQRLRVHIETQQLPIRRASLQDAASVSARTYRTIHIPPAIAGLQSVYNLLVKYRFMRSHNNRYDDAEFVFERSSVEKRALLASVS